MVKILYTELGHKVEMHKQVTLAVLQPKIKTNPNFHHMNKPFQISPSFINLVVTNKEGGGLKERGGWIYLSSPEKGGLLKREGA